MRPVYLVELPTLTPREIALSCCAGNEALAQDVTLAIEIKRAERRYAATFEKTR